MKLYMKQKTHFNMRSISINYCKLTKCFKAKIAFAVIETVRYKFPENQTFSKEKCFYFKSEFLVKILKRPH